MKSVTVPLLALALCTGVGSIANAEILVRPDGGYNVRQSTGTPSRGLTMQAVLQQFGEPLKRARTVGNPPISTWHYAGYKVYFERDVVLHTVITVAGR